MTPEKEKQVVERVCDALRFNGSIPKLHFTPPRPPRTNMPANRTNKPTT
ncbi:MAG: hypothetical protein HC898_13035 [Phycisphaerales bacterium]|nr:hypothetical protein [Phycisphaerales bacterium]